MTLGKYPATPPRVGEEVSYVSVDGSVVTIRGVEADRWSVRSDVIEGEIVKDGSVYRTRTRVAPIVTTAQVDAWADLFTMIYS